MKSIIVYYAAGKIEGSQLASSTKEEETYADLVQAVIDKLVEEHGRHGCRIWGVDKLD